jgi:hypothetical protein
VSCLILLSQQSLETWLRAGALIAVGVVLYGCTRLGKPVAAVQG